MIRSNWLAAICRELILLAALASSLGITPEAAAQISPPQQLTGTLPSGLAYHIERIGQPGEGASFQLLVRVGHLQGWPEQQVAHIVEHIVIGKLPDMLSKGTIWARAQRLGATVNASTGSTETSYVLKLPSTNPDAIGAALEIVTAWAASGALSNEDIDRERSAVVEEARRTSDEGRRFDYAQQSIWYPVPMPQGPVPDPIGRVSATAQGIRALYGRYYVPSNMAIVIVGDVDPEAVLRALHLRLGDFSPTAAPPKLRVPAVDLRGGHYLPFAMNERDETQVQVSFKYRAPLSRRGSRARALAAAKLIEEIAANGFANLAAAADGPVEGGNLTFARGPFDDANLILAQASVRAGAAKEGLIDVLGLLATLRHHGVSKTAFEGARNKLLARPLPQATADTIATRWMGYFSRGEFEPSPSDVRKALGELTAPQLNRVIREWLDPEHRDIFVIHPEGESNVPGAEGIPALVATAEEREAVSLLAASPVEEAVRAPDLEPVANTLGDVPAPVLEARGIVRWTLPESGATLLFRPTSDDQIRIVMRRPGGSARFEGLAALQARAAVDVIRASGLGGLTRAELDRFLAQQGLTVRARVGVAVEEVLASGSADKFPLMIALIRAQMTNPPCSRRAFDEYKARQLAAQQAKGSLADDAAFDRVIGKAFGNRQYLEPGELDDIRFEDVCQQFRTMFGDTAGTAIVIEGNLPSEEAYRALASSLDLPPALDARSNAIRPFAPLAGGRTVLNRGSKPIANVFLALMTEGDKRAGRMLVEVLSVRMFARLREREKGTYAVATDFADGPIPGVGLLGIRFECAPENVDRLIAAAKDEIERFGREGATDAELERVGVLKLPEPSASDIANAWIAEKTLVQAPAPTPAELRAWARAYLVGSRLHEFIRLPEAQEP